MDVIRYNGFTTMHSDPKVVAEYVVHQNATYDVLPGEPELEPERSRRAEAEIAALRQQGA